MNTSGIEYMPLRKIRKANKDSLSSLKDKLAQADCLSSIANLSQLERGKTWPNKRLVDSISKLYEITEMEVLYPERFIEGTK